MWHGTSTTAARIDSGFGSNGLLTTSFAEGASSALGVTVDPQDRIVVAGFVDALDGVQFAFARYRPDGQLDPSFSGNGRARVSFAEGRSLATSVTIDGAGRIVAAGAVGLPAGDAFAVVRLREDGTPDPAFNANGKVSTEFEEGRGFALAVSVDSTHRIVAAGFVNAGVPGSVFGLVRYLELATSAKFDVAAVATIVPSSQSPGDAANLDAPLFVVVGTNDGGSSVAGNAREVYDAGGRPKHFVLIEAANHFGFTDGLCFDNDGTAGINREDQQRIAYAYLTAFLQCYIRGEASNATCLDGTRKIEQLESFGIDVEADV